MITIVVGAQYGGEGKGKVAAYIAFKEKPQIACRCGGPNSSHTVRFDGRVFKLRMMPTAAVVDPGVTVVFGAGSLIHIRTLLDEAALIGFKGRLCISPQAGIVTDEIVERQRQDQRYEHIGSTLTGTGYASAERSLRRLLLARDFKELTPYLVDTEMLLWEATSAGSDILIEGHQGYGLSNYHGDYPFVSSRDSTAAGMLSELGLGPIQKNLRVVLAVKMFPTRNHNGQLGEEVSEEEAGKLGIFEFGGGSWGIDNRRRRVALFDHQIVARAAKANSATEIAITGADYFQKSVANTTKLDPDNIELREFIRFVRDMTATEIRYVSTGADTAATIYFPRSRSRSQRHSHATRPGH